MKRTLIAAATSMVVLGCSTRAFNDNVNNTPPVVYGYNIAFSENEFKSYVDDVNANLYLYFSYTRALNRLALSRGWKPPDYKPICEFIAWGKLREPPLFVVSDDVVTMDEVNSELAEYIKLSRELYKLQAEEFENLEAAAKELCTY